MYLNRPTRTIGSKSTKYLNSTLYLPLTNIHNHDSYTENYINDNNQETRMQPIGITQKPYRSNQVLKVMYLNLPTHAIGSKSKQYPNSTLYLPQTNIRNHDSYTENYINDKNYETQTQPIGITQKPYRSNQVP